MKAQAILKAYFAELTEVARRGDAREESFYSSLESLLRQYATSTGRSEVHVTTLPKATEAGNPDFRIWDGQNQIIGYIEAKKPTEENLDTIENSEQLKRYRHTFPNLILEMSWPRNYVKNSPRVRARCSGSMKRFRSI